MRQGLTEASETYAQLKDLVMSEIPEPDSELTFENINSERTMFAHFVNDDVDRVNTFENLLIFLYNHYFL